MTTSADVFRALAHDAKLRASNAMEEADKAAWLELAEDWLRLADAADKVAADIRKAPN